VSAIAGIIRRLAIEPWQAIDAEAREERAAFGDRFDWRLVVVLVTVAVSLTLQEYYGFRGKFQELFPFDPTDPYWTLKSFAWWSGWRFGGFVIMPAVVIALMPGERIRDYFVSPAGFIRHLWIYLALFLLVAPLVFVASRTDSFSLTYPFYRNANRSPFDLWAWEGLYALQFVSLEFFFRGFMLRGLRRSFGAGAIFVMVVPYCMVHFGKPMAETLGAVVAGTVLGTLALRTRSIWGGVLIHIAVAVTMDLLALGHCPPPGMGPCPLH
jgi:membrane protease YdiL (CAAX protease family)